MRGLISVWAFAMVANLQAGVPYWDAKGSIEAPDVKISADTKGRYWSDASRSDRPNLKVAVDLTGKRWGETGLNAQPDFCVSLDFDGKYWNSSAAHERPDVRLSFDFDARHWKDIGTSRPDERVAMKMDDGWGGRKVTWSTDKADWDSRSSPDRRISLDASGAKWDLTSVHEGPDLRVSLDMTGKHWEDRNVSDSADKRLSISYDRNGPTQDIRRLVLVWLTQSGYCCP